MKNSQDNKITMIKTLKDMKVKLLRKVLKMNKENAKVLSNRI